MDHQIILSALKELETRLDQRFDRVDQRFEQVDQHFQQVDQRFQQVDQRFEQFDQRFGQMETRWRSLETRWGRLQRKVERGFAQVRDDIDLLRYTNSVALERHVETRLDLADVVRRLITVEQRLGIEPRR